MKNLLIVVCLIGLMPLVTGQNYGINGDTMVQAKVNGSVFGETNYNVSSGLGGATTILGLSKDYFLKLGVLLLLTLIILSVRPFMLGYAFFFFALIVVTDVMDILVIPSSLMIALLFLILLEAFSKKHYEGAA
jgi:hypothetical protein